MVKDCAFSHIIQSYRIVKDSKSRRALKCIIGSRVKAILLNRWIFLIDGRVRACSLRSRLVLASMERQIKAVAKKLNQGDIEAQT